MTTSPELDLSTSLTGRYTIERELGRGGMATVYLARDLRHERLVALKLVRPDLGAALGAERFAREIKLAAGLQHPHILSVFDSGETLRGQLWFTMPYVEGESLRDRLDRDKQLPLEDALRIVHDVADALDYAHRHGVIHRDIKPANILLSGGHAFVADFGVARATRRGGEDVLAGGTLTDAGVTLGTPMYMSPEQATGERTLDGRTDLYALGCVLYEMLAGEAPYTGATPQVILAKRLGGDVPSVSRLRPAVPALVNDAIRKSLAPAPADRFATTGEFGKALETAEHAGLVHGITRHRRVPIGAALLGLGVVVAVGLLFAWRRYTGSSIGPADVGAASLAVLPFDNEGDSADAYFADGMTDEVRSKLSALSAIEVMASASSKQYRHTTKSPQQIGRELGVRYLLVGRVRWDKRGGVSSVRVDPELVQVGDVARPTSRWEQSFDAPLTDVFQVQTNIASRVAEQLRVRLGTHDRQTLQAHPTQDLDAYDAYLRGKAIDETGVTPDAMRPAIAAYAEAVRRDSTFALAWAALSVDKSELYFLFLGTPTLADADAARRAAERALALDPDLPEAHAAMGDYLARVRNDYPRALIEDSISLTHAPNNAALLSRMAITEMTLGSWDAAVAHFEAAERLDPQVANVTGRLALADVFLRRYPAAETAIHRSLALEPSNLFYVENHALIALAKGDLDGARAAVHAIPAPVDSAALVAYLAEWWDLGWVLDSAEQRVLFRLRPDAFDNSRGSWAIVLAEQYALRGDMVKARIYADSTLIGFNTHLNATPDDWGSQVGRALALAYLGRKEAAIHEVDRAMALRPASKDAFLGPYIQHQAVRVYILVGEKEKALDLLEPLLRTPYYLSPAWLQIDPNFTALHGDARFERLIAKH